MQYKSACKSQVDFPNDEMDRCKIFQWESVLGVPDRVNISCLMHDTHYCQLDVKMTNN